MIPAEPMKDPRSGPHNLSMFIGEYTDPQGSRRGFGALLIGYYEKERLIYAGKVGTGFDERTLADLSRRPAAGHVVGPLP
jgi:ATP-dependent DNA ligase